MIDRKLASIQRIVDILPHPNADKLEIARILGWHAVVLKDQFKKGDLVVYIETDAILPEGNPCWEFMRTRKFHVKTIRLRGQISQGLVFPLGVLPKKDPLITETVISPDFTIGTLDYQEGEDVTDLLGIVQYQPYIPAQLSGKVKGSFPNFLFKSDEIRIQTVPNVLTRYHDMQLIATEKVDGTSFTCYLRGGNFGICSRNLELNLEDNTVYCKITRELNLRERLAQVGKNIAIQGELIGPGIQKNKYELPCVQLKLFNILDIDLGAYVGYDEFLRLAALLGLDTVPRVCEIMLNNALSIDALVELSKGFSLINPKTLREGLVFRPEVYVYDPDLRGKLSFKVINPEFLLKYDE